MKSPPGGATVDAEVAVLEPLIAVIGALLGEPASVDQLETVSAETLHRYIAIWGMLHGLVSLVINHHLPFVDEPERVIADQVVGAARSLQPDER